MDLGLLTTCLPEVGFPELARWASQAGFRTLDADCVAKGSRWYDGSRLVPAKIDDSAAAEIEQLLSSTGLRLSCLSFHDNMLDRDDAARTAKWRLLDATIRAAARLKVPVVSCLVGRDPTQRLGECIATWARLAADAISVAEESGIRLAVENSPRPGWQTEDLPGNAAFAPELWEKIFTHARGDNLGLNFDPAPLHWLGIDPIEAATAYAERIFHVRARDAEIFPDRRNDCSVLRPQGGWWRYRLPGLGQIPWTRLLALLQENGYDGPLSLVHDDPVWAGSQEKIKRGLDFSRRYLEQRLV